MSSKRLQIMHKNKIPVILISGFLGSGKTTLLLNLLEEQGRSANRAVIINDFGSIGIDAQLVREPGTEVVEMSSGCICCTLQNDVEYTLSRLTESYSLEEIYVEASGIADPQAIEKGIHAFQDRYGLQLERTVTVLDIDYWDSQGAFGEVFFSQLQHADLIVLNKVDLFSEAETARCLQELSEAYQEAIVVPTSYCRLDMELIRPSAGNSLDKKRPYMPRTGSLSIPRYNASQATKGFVTFSLCDDIVLEEQKLKSFLQQVPAQLFRIKGIVNLPRQSKLLNFAGGKFELTEWREQESQTRLVFIGWGDIDQDRIVNMLRECVHSKV